MAVAGRIVIRKYQPSDQDKVLDLFADGMKEYEHQGPEGSWAWYIKRSMESDLVNIEQVYDIGKEDDAIHIGCFWVAERDGDLIGMVAAEALNDRPGVAELRRMSVSRNARRLGLAKRLVKTLEDWCRAHQFNRVILSTRESMQVACSLYQLLGYVRNHTEIYKFEKRDGAVVAFKAPGDRYRLANY